MPRLCTVMRSAFCTLLLTACASQPAPAPTPALVSISADPNATPTPTPFQPLLPTLSPPTSIPPTLTPTQTLPPPTPTFTPSPTFTPAPTLPPASPPPASERTQYTFYVVFDYDARRLSVDETIYYTNRTGEALNELVLAVEPNRWADCFVLQSLTIEGSPPAYNLDGPRMTVTLPNSLPSGSAVTLSLQFELNVPPKRYEGTFGYRGYQINLTDWYPFVVPYFVGQGWVLHDAGSFGEHLVYDSSDFEVNLRFTDAENAPVVAASAPAEAAATGSTGEWRRYRLAGARTFVFSASPHYTVESSAVGQVALYSYYFPGHEGGGGRMIWAATQSVALYAARFGPYPYPSLSVVETELADGHEFDGLIFLGSTFYDQYNGGARNNLVMLGVHEIAHQWWFGLVGSDQALEPWLDEALSTYTERIFYEITYPNLLDWWWGFRVNYFKPAGWVDTNIYDGGSFRKYTNAVYLRGALFLEALRYRIGDEDFFAFLKDYAAQKAYGQATAQDFFNILDQHTSVNYSDLVAAYFQNPH